MGVAWKSTVKVHIIASTRSSGSTDWDPCLPYRSLTRGKFSNRDRDEPLLRTGCIIKHEFPSNPGWKVVKPLRPYRVSATRARWIAFNRQWPSQRSWLNIDTTSPYRAAYQSHDAGYTSRSILEPLSNRITDGRRGKFEGGEKEFPSSSLFCC